MFMSNEYLKSILITTLFLFLVATIMSAGCIGGSDDAGLEEPTQKSSHIIVIQPPSYCEKPGRDCPESGYLWNNNYNHLIIQKPGEYEFANTRFPDKFDITIERDIQEEITIDGRGVIINRINGHRFLNLKNVRIETSNFDYVHGFGITECNNIVDSSILVRGSTNVISSAFGIFDLYGNMERTKITVTLTGSSTGPWGVYSSATGVMWLHGTISSGEITAISPGYASGVDTVMDGATISGGTFTATSLTDFVGVDRLFAIIFKSEFTTHPFGKKIASGVSQLSGTISGGEFTVTADENAYGVGDVSGKISGGEFTVTAGEDARGVGIVLGDISGGEFTVFGKEAYGFGFVNTDGRISGGTFWSIGWNQAYGIGQISSLAALEKMLIGGTINAWSSTKYATIAIGITTLTGADVSPYTFTAPTSGEQYTGEATEYTINDAMLRTIYSTKATPAPTQAAPGFGVLFAFAGLGVAALFGRRQN